MINHRKERDVSEQIEPFEFECEDDKIKLSHDDGECIWYEVTDSAGRKLNRKWQFTITPSACIRALLAERTRRADEIANLTAQCNTFKEQLEASEKSRHNLRLFANNETYFDLPMSGPDIDTRNRLFELRAEACADELRKQAFSESVSRCAQKVQQMVVERENLKTERDTALAEAERLRGQLPEEMQECTIKYVECSQGHGRLEATNWIDHGCEFCEIQRLRGELEAAKKHNEFILSRWPDDTPAPVSVTTT